MTQQIHVPGTQDGFNAVVSAAVYGCRPIGIASQAGSKHDAMALIAISILEIQIAIGFEGPDHLAEILRVEKAPTNPPTRLGPWIDLGVFDLKAIEPIAGYLAELARITVGARKTAEGPIDNVTDNHLTPTHAARMAIMGATKLMSEVWKHVDARAGRTSIARIREAETAFERALDGPPLVDPIKNAGATLRDGIQDGRASRFVSQPLVDAARRACAPNLEL